jgi:hypothetical protein
MRTQRLAAILACGIVKKAGATAESFAWLSQTAPALLPHPSD